MMHPAPMRARSRTWDWFQMLVPSPISAWGATSAVGWMRTDGRSFMRTPAVRRILPCPLEGLVSASSSRGGEGPDGVGGRRHRLAPMAHAVLLFWCELSRGQTGRELEDRVIAEASVAAAFRGHRPFDGAAEQLDRWAIRTRLGERQPADHARAAVADPVEPIQEDARVVPG